MVKTVEILGLSFINELPEKVFQLLSVKGGLMTVPSGPGLSTIPDDQYYYKALLNSDVTIADSGYMVLIWNYILRGPKIKHLSGVEFMEFFIGKVASDQFCESIFLVNPSENEDFANRSLIKGLNNSINIDSYVAPYYSSNGIIEDPILLELLEEKKPHWILLNIAGGKQEKLGSWLKEKLSYKPAIICTGAAIAFFTGNQVKLPVWVVNLYFGWLVRIISSPSKYFRRYTDAFKLFPLLLKYKDNRVNFNVLE